MLNPDYRSHDAHYRRLREHGAEGWDTPDVYQRMRKGLDLVLPGDVPPASVHILELGCGAGNLSLLLAQEGYAVTGVDISATAIDWAQEQARAANVAARFVVDDVCSLSSLPPASYDLVIDGHCWHCVIGPDRARFLAAARRALKPDGILLIMTMCGDVTSPRLLPFFDPATRCVLHEGRPARYVGDPEFLTAEIAASGFDIWFEAFQRRLDVDDQDELLVGCRIAGH